MSTDGTDKRESQPLLSIVIPCFNAMPYIEETLSTIVEWPRERVEILVQDGGSTDGTVEVVQAFGDRIQLVSEPDSGQSEALNRAIERATGRFVGWLNADDLYSVNSWEALEAEMSRSDAPDVIFGDYSVVSADGVPIRRMKLSNFSWEDLVLRGLPVWSGAIVWNRSVFDRFGLFDESFHYCMDAEFYFRVAGRVTTLHTPVELGSFRIHGDSKTGGTPWGFLKETHALRREYAGTGVIPLVHVMAMDARQAIYILTQGVRQSHVWSRVRGTHRY